MVVTGFTSFKTELYNSHEATKIRIKQNIILDFGSISRM